MTKNFKKDFEKLEKYCLENDVLAMASVQIGIPKRLIYIKNTNLDLINKMNRNGASEEEKYNEAKILINPIIKKRIGLTTYWETCASCLDYMGLVKRPYKIEVEYFDRMGKKQKEVFQGFPATVLSHEYDHLDGILHMDIAQEVLNMPRKERIEYRKTHGYTIQTKTGDFEILKKE